MNLPFFEYLYARKAYLLTVLQLNSNTPGRRITAAIYTVKLTLFIWENIYPGLDRERQSEQLPHLTTSFCCGRKDWGSRRCHWYSGHWEGMPSSVQRKYRKYCTLVRGPGHGGKNTDMGSKIDFGSNPYSAIYLVFSLKQTAFFDA